MQLITALLLLATASSSLGARILGILPMPSPSHGILVESLMRELGNRGHHVTYIATHPPAQGPVPNMTLIHVPNVHEEMMKQLPGMQRGMQDMFKGMSPWFMFIFGLTAMATNDVVLRYPEVQKLIKSDEKFDLVIGEIFLAESLSAGFAQKFKAPLIGLQPFLPNIWGNYMVGNPAQSSYIPDPTLGLSTEMTFCERLYNFIYQMAWDVFHPLIYLPKQWERWLLKPCKHRDLKDLLCIPRTLIPIIPIIKDAVMRKHFGSDVPRIHDILRNTSLVLVNHHHSLAFPRPYLPNMVEIGGYHVKPPKPLPENLKKYMDESKQGVVLFSMGSNLKSADMPAETSQQILKAFARLPYNVIWKFEKEYENLPKNVRIDKWLPQSDILAHPNLKLFITHGGLLSTTEAVTRGVPVLGIPIFADQPLNMKLTEQAGLGRTVQFKEITEDLIYNEVMELTTNSKYRDAAKLKSAVFQDDPLPAMEKAMWWIEYVLRYNGAPHLRSSAQRLCWYQLHQLDVIAVLLLGTVGSLYIIIVVVRTLLRKICGKKEKTSKKKEKKN